MTKEEAIDIIKKYDINSCGYCHQGGNEVEEAFNVAIKALKQDDILNKIRAEIKALSPEPTVYDVVDGNPYKDAVWETLADVLKIIDKYKAESEVKNDTCNKTFS